MGSPQSVRCRRCGDVMVSIHASREQVNWQSAPNPTTAGNAIKVFRMEWSFLSAIIFLWRQGPIGPD